MYYYIFPAVAEGEAAKPVPAPAGKPQAPAAADKTSAPAKAGDAAPTGTEAGTSAGTGAAPGQAAPPPDAGGGFMSMIVLLGLMVLIFYFLLIRPQKKRDQQQRNMLDALKKNQKVVTVGGIYGVIDKIKKDEGQVVLKVDDNTRMTFSLRSVQGIADKKDEGGASKA